MVFFQRYDIPVNMKIMKVNGAEALSYVQFYSALVINILEIQHQIFYQFFTHNY